MSRRSAIALIALACLLPCPALAATCGDDAAGFDAWLAAFRSEAPAKGVSPRALAALTGVSYSPQVIALDRHQGVFHKSFEEFGLPRIAQRINKARAMMQVHAGTLQRIDAQFGVPSAVVVAIW